MVLQDLCRQGLGWDEDISNPNMKVWQQWIVDLPELQDIKIPRCYKPTDYGPTASCELHVFSDASDQGYGIAAYLRFTSEKNRPHCTLIMGKARVAPLKKITIPRMELAAACVAVRISHLLIKELQYTVTDTYYWTDSMAVIRYIANETTRFHTFVANRLAVIRDSTSVHQWRYVRTDMNPADAASRGMKLKAFLNADQWFHGPAFLWNSKTHWPTSSIDPSLLEIKEEDDSEVKRTVAVAVIDESADTMNTLLASCSSWMKLKKIVSWYLIIMENLLHRVKRRKMWNSELATGVQDSTNRADVRQRQRQAIKDAQISLSVKIEPAILEKAEKSLIRYVQKQCFPNVLKTLKNTCQDSSTRKEAGEFLKTIQKLDPVLVDGVVRVGGRLERACIPFEAKHPVLLPKDSPLSKLIVEDTHVAVGHMGKNAMMTSMRQKYWILGAGYLCKQLTSKCVVCKKYRAKAAQQKMADLSTDRLVAEEPPFSRVGVDYFGPFLVKRGRSEVKRYGVVFTCMATRAVHLEVASSLDTDSCINSLRRFIARRGRPKIVRSDNGTNLVGCERELKEEIKKWNQDKIHKTLLQQSIKWEFNPPAGSHHGGVWERMIRSVRKVLYGLLQNQVIRLDDESLQTLFCEVEAILNGRPLTKIPDDPNDLNPLTPYHLLILRSGEKLPPGSFEASDCYVKRRWRQVQYLADTFWKRWSKEYLSMLQERQKWLHPRKNVSANDVVLLMDNSPRNSWSLGRVVDVVTDRKGFVRIVKVKTSTTTLVRPVDKLCIILEADDPVT